MKGGRHIAKQRGIIENASTYKRLEVLMHANPWLVLKALSTLPEHDRKKLKWVLAKR